MKKLLIATTALALGMGPALAQSSDSSSDMSNSSSTTMSSSSDSSSNSSMSTEDMVASQDKVLKALEDAGYTNAEIMDAAYMVQAQTPDGEQVLMMIDTSGRVMGAQRAPENGATGSSSSTMDSSSGSSSMDSSSGSSTMDSSSGSEGSSDTSN